MKQKVWTYIRWDSTGRLVDERWVWYEGPLVECKGGGEAKAQLDKQNQLVQDQLTQQKQIRDQIMGSFGKYLSGSGEGFDPAQLAAMKSQFLNANTSNFNAARGQVLAGLNARGGGGGAIPAGGDMARSLSGLEGAQASSQSQGLLGTDIQNLQQALTNRFNTGSLLSGQSAQLGQNIGTFNAGAGNALGNYVTAVNKSPFMEALGAGLGSGIGLGTAGGIFKTLGGLGTKGPGSYPPTPGQ